jgi:hypothetical protein
MEIRVLGKSLSVARPPEEDTVATARDGYRRRAELILRKAQQLCFKK